MAQSTPTETASRPWTDNEHLILVKAAIDIGVVDESKKGLFEGKVVYRSAEESYNEWVALKKRGIPPWIAMVWGIKPGPRE